MVVVLDSSCEQALEEQFPEPPLLPKDEDARKQVLEVCDECNDLANSGFGFMREGRLESDGNATSSEAGSSSGSSTSKFEEKLNKLEASIVKNGGPFIMG